MPQIAAIAEAQPTEHPHIVRTEGICGGKPRIQGSRISVRTVAELYLAGEAAKEIADTYHHVGLAAVRSAISYYLDHRDEIDSEIEENRVENVVAGHGVALDEDGTIRFDAR